MIELKIDNSRAQIDAGELVSYSVNNYEFIHQKGSPGWRNSDTEMFPIIGPTADANYIVKTPNGNAVQDQHGLLRELTYSILEQSSETAVYQKIYKANSKVRNSKYPEKSTISELSWPYDFQFQKIFRLTKEGLEIIFKITAEEGMPYMLGYHPAFKTDDFDTQIKISEEKVATVTEIKEVGARAYKVANSTSLLLLNKHHLKVKTEGFGQFMLWTEVDNMLCIEPITFYPYDVSQDKLHEGFNFMSNKPEIYKVFLEPVKI